MKSHRIIKIIKANNYVDTILPKLHNFLTITTIKHLCCLFLTSYIFNQFQIAKI